MEFGLPCFFNTSELDLVGGRRGSPNVQQGEKTGGVMCHVRNFGGLWVCSGWFTSYDLS